MLLPNRPLGLSLLAPKALVDFSALAPNGLPELLLLPPKGVPVLLPPPNTLEPLLLPAAAKPSFFANEAKPPELGAAVPALANGLAESPEPPLLFAKLEKLDWPNAGAFPLAPVAHGEALMPSCEACPKALGLPKAGADGAEAPPKELEPNAGCAGFVLVPDAAEPQGDAFWPICEEAPKAVGVGEAPKAGFPAGWENGDGLATAALAGVVVVADPSTAAKPG